MRTHNPHVHPHAYFRSGRPNRWSEEELGQIDSVRMVNAMQLQPWAHRRLRDEIAELAEELGR